MMPLDIHPRILYQLSMAQNMSIFQLGVLIAFVTLLTCCDNSPSITSNSNSQRVEAIAFDGKVYRSLDGRTTLALISQNECEYSEGSTTLLCKYTDDANVLRVVVSKGGSDYILYYRITEKGIQDNQGNLLLDAVHFATATEQARIAREAELTRLRLVQKEKEHQREMEAQKELEHKRAQIARLDDAAQSIFKFLANGSVFKGVCKNNDGGTFETTPNVTYEITVNGEMTVNKDSKDAYSHERYYIVTANLRWLGLSGWGDNIMEHKGVILINISDPHGKDDVFVKAQFGTRAEYPTYALGSETPIWGWVTKENGSRWNGSQFVGIDDFSFSLKKP